MTAGFQKKQVLNNKDYFGDQWELAPGGHQKVSTSQSCLWELRAELNAIAAFFRNMQTSDMDSDDYYGVSLCLLRMGRRIGKIHDELGRAVKEVPKGSSHMSVKVN